MRQGPPHQLISMKSPSDPPDASSLPESLRLLQLVWKLKGALDRTSVEMDRKLGVSGPQRFMLRFVGLAPGITVKGLAEVLSTDVAKVTPELEHLVAKNLLVKQDGSAGYFLTAAGVGVNAAMAGTVEEAISLAADEASPYERASFRRMLERIVDKLKPRAL